MKQLTPAYAKGFLDGYEQGIDNNEYNDDAERSEYKHGYEAGIAYYCAETHPEDENQ